MKGVTASKANLILSQISALVMHYVSNQIKYTGDMLPELVRFNEYLWAATTEKHGKSTFNFKKFIPLFDDENVRNILKKYIENDVNRGISFIMSILSTNAKFWAVTNSIDYDIDRAYEVKKLLGASERLFSKTAELMKRYKSLGQDFSWQAALHHVAEAHANLTTYSKYNMPPHPAMGRKRNPRNAEIAFFIRDIAAESASMFGKYNNDDIGQITNAIFPDKRSPITSENVRKNIKDPRKSNKK